MGDRNQSEQVIGMERILHILEEIGFFNIIVREAVVDQSQIEKADPLITPVPGSRFGAVKHTYINQQLELVVKGNDQTTSVLSCEGPVRLPGGEETLEAIMDLLTSKLERIYSQAETFRQQETRVNSLLGLLELHSKIDTRLITPGGQAEKHEIVDFFLAYIHSIIPKLRSASLVLYDEETKKLRVASAWGVKLMHLEEEGAFNKLQRVLLSDNGPLFRHAEFDDLSFRSRRPGDWVLFPMRSVSAGGDVRYLGGVSVSVEEGSHLDWVQLKALQAAVGMFSLKLSLGFYTQELEWLAQHDGLTKLFNKNTGEKKLAQSFLQAQEKQAPLSLLMVDLDHFKLVNDDHGHLAGDMVLRRFAELLLQIEKEYSGSYAVRCGGEEFQFVFPGKSLSDVLKIAEQLRIRIESRSFDIGELAPIHKTASIGASSTEQPEIQTLESLVVAADIAAYEVKDTGRNRVQGWRSDLGLVSRRKKQ